MLSSQYLRRIATCFIILGGMILSGSALSAELRWRSQPFQYNAENQKLSVLLREFAASQNVPAVIAPELDATVNAKFNLPPAKMMELLSATFGLIWYYDGSILYVYPAAAAKSELVRASGPRAADLIASLEKLKIYDPRFPIIIDNQQNTLLVSGPPRYVDMVLNLARVVDENAGRKGTAEIRVFPLKYAWAADTKFSYGGQEIVFPGMVQTLRDMFEVRGGGGGAKPAPKQSSSSGTLQSLAKLSGTGLKIEAPESVASIVQDVTKGGGSSGGGADFFDGGLPRFRADSRMNAILIRDLPERMYQYEKLIPQLDTKPGIIEIEAQIVEISGDALEELGVEWRASKPGTYDLQLGAGRLPQLREETSTGTGAPFATTQDDQLTPSGALMTLISGDAKRFLTARINALTQNGSAKYLARPKVITLDNVEALLDSSSNYYVRVAGNLEVGLFNVTVGTSLRVTPLIVNEGESRRIKMAVRIEDGATLPNQGVDQIPATRKSTIGTQTFIAEGQSLLIAGYSEERDSQNTSGVPGLSKLPGIGALFRTNTDTHNRSERLFMITPRIVMQ